jgi:hypothetical protein
VPTEWALGREEAPRARSARAFSRDESDISKTWRARSSRDLGKGGYRGGYARRSRCFSHTSSSIAYVYEAQTARVTSSSSQPPPRTFEKMAKKIPMPTGPHRKPLGRIGDGAYELLRCFFNGIEPKRTWSRLTSATGTEIFLKTAERQSQGKVGFTATESSRRAGQSPSRPDRRNAHLVAS